MNFTICKKDSDDGKVIRNWEKQCFPCVHAHLVIVRGITEDGTSCEVGGVYLFQCPHIGTRHKIIGYDTLRSEPIERTDIVASVSTPFISVMVKNSLNWQELQPPLEGYKKTEIAKIPREQWKKLLYIDAPLIPKPCPRCNAD